MRMSAGKIHQKHQSRAALRRAWLLRPGPVICLVVSVAVFTSAGCKPRAEHHVGTERVDPVYGHLLRPLTNLPVVTLRIEGVELRAEIARTAVEIATGMMFRTNVEPGTGMIFVFPDTAQRNFYMRNCLVPLSVAFIAPDGTILETADIDPGEHRGVTSHSWEVQYVLEVPRGWFASNGIRPGATVRTVDGPLKSYFFPAR